MTMPEVIMPKMGDAMEAGTLSSWLKHEGDQVEVGDVLAEIETDKATMELEAEDAGVLTRLIAGEGDEIAVGKPIAVISADGEAPDEASQAAKETADSGGGRETAETEDAETKDAEGEPAETKDADTEAPEIKDAETKDAESGEQGARAREAGKQQAATSPFVPYSAPASRKITQLSSRTAVSIIPLTSFGVTGATTFRPGKCP